MHRYFAGGCVLFGLIVAGGVASGKDEAVAPRLRAMVGVEMKEQRIPGMAVGVVNDGKVVFVEGFGVASLELGSPAGAETLFGLGSVSKQFTAGAIMLLVEDGKLRLDERLPEIFDWTPVEWSEVTVRHLLTHTSGIRDEEWTGGILEFDRAEHDQLTVMKTAFGPLGSKPGEKFAYSNTGYRALGMIVEKRSGRSYWDFLEERIFQPLKMERTRNSDPGTVIAGRARGYGLDGERFVNRDPVTASAAFSQGALVSSVEDLAKWDAALDGGKLLKRSSIEAMWSETTLNDGSVSKYGFGWQVRPVPGHRTVAHGGGLPGFATFVWKFVDDKLTVIVLTNQERASLAGLSLNIAGLYAPELLQPEIKRQF